MSSHDAELRALDQLARRRAQEVFDRPVALEAGAGTGKTAALVARVVQWCLGPGWTRHARGLSDPDRIAPTVLSGVVAITFTEAAAAEMEDRIGRAFLSLAGSTLPLGIDEHLLPQAAVRAERARALHTALDHLVVRTIHAFCRRVLAAYPLEAGLDPSFVVDADESQIEALVVERVSARVGEAYGSPMEPDYLVLAREGIGPREIAGALLALAREGVPSAALGEDSFSPPRVRAAAEELRGRLTELRRCGLSRLQRLGGRAQRSVATASALDHFERGLESAAATVDADGLCARARDLLERVDGRLSDWARGRFLATELTALAGLEQDFADKARRSRELLLAVAAAHPQLFSSARRVLGPLLCEVETSLRGRGIATFASLLADCARLLAAEPTVRRRLRRSIDQLLVDELQDTDRVQAAIVRAIALDHGADEPRPGLFLVGDPKQSIYGWRSADLAAYEDLLEGLRGAGGEVHRLTVNFRAVPAILAEVDRAVRPIMIARSGLQSEYQELVASPRRAAAASVTTIDEVVAPVEYWPSIAWDEATARPQAKTLAREAAELEAVAIASDIVRLHERGLGWRSFALLLRSTGDLAIYLAAFRHAGVPYDVARDRGYYQRREVIEAAALVRVVFDANDPLALVTLLRSAWVGVPDVALPRLWARGFPGLVADLMSARGREMRELRVVIGEVAAMATPGVPGIERVKGWEHGLLHAVRVIGELRGRALTASPDELVGCMRRWLAVDALEATRYLGDYRVANLGRFFRGVLVALEASAGDVQVVLRQLRENVAEARAAEEARPREAGLDAVSILTIHQAKGLDFDHVYVAQLHKGRPRGGDSGTRAERIEGQWEISLLGFPTLRYDRAVSRREAVESAERVRTLYVAMTRARDRLVMVGKWSDDEAVGVEGASSYSQLLRARHPLLPDVEALMTRVASSHRSSPGSAFIDIADTRVRFPAFVPSMRLTPPSAQAGRVAPVSRDAAQRLAAELRQRRAAASARMTQSLGGTASGEAHRDDRGETLARRFEEAPQEADEASRGGDVARAVGTAIHRVLETFDLAAALETEGARQRESLRAALASLLPDASLAAGLARAERLLAQLLQGDCLRRLRALASHVIARELPILLLPSSPERGALGFVTGTIDLLYRDPENGAVVVADYKTDATEDGVGLAARARQYAAQGAVYTRGVQEALRLAGPPRFELWFLHADRVVSCPAGEGS